MLSTFDGCGTFDGCKQEGWGGRVGVGFDPWAPCMVGMSYLGGARGITTPGAHDEGMTQPSYGQNERYVLTFCGHFLASSLLILVSGPLLAVRDELRFAIIILQQDLHSKRSDIAEVARQEAHH